MKKLAVLSIVLALLPVMVFAGQNAEGKLTTLPYDSPLDPNMFYHFNIDAPPNMVMTDQGMAVIVFRLSNTDPKGLPQRAVIVQSEDGVLQAYGYDINGEILVYELNKEKTKYVKYIDKSGGY